MPAPGHPAHARHPPIEIPVHHMRGGTAATRVEGSVAHRQASPRPSIGPERGEIPIGIEHGAGILDTIVVARQGPAGLDIHRAADRRSARILLRGHVPPTRASDSLRAALSARLQ